MCKCIYIHIFLHTLTHTQVCVCAHVYVIIYIMWQKNFCLNKFLVFILICIQAFEHSYSIANTWFWIFFLAERDRDRETHTHAYKHTHTHTHTHTRTHTMLLGRWRESIFLNLASNAMNVYLLLPKISIQQKHIKSPSSRQEIFLFYYILCNPPHRFQRRVKRGTWDKPPPTEYIKIVSQE